MLTGMELDTGSSKKMSLWFVPWEPEEGGESQHSRQRTLCTVRLASPLHLKLAFIKSSAQWGRQCGQADL